MYFARRTHNSVYIVFNRLRLDQRDSKGSSNLSPVSMLCSTQRVIFKWKKNFDFVFDVYCPFYELYIFYCKHFQIVTLPYFYKCIDVCFLFDTIILCLLLWLFNLLEIKITGSDFSYFVHVVCNLEFLLYL